MYKTKQEVTDMIQSLEYDMQRQRSYNQREESRILQEIRSLKNSLVDLDNLQSFKTEFDELMRSLKEKRDRCQV